MLELQCSWPDYWSLHIVQNPANNKEDCYCYYKKREKYCINNNNERKCNVAVIIYESDFKQSWQATTYTTEFKVKLVFGNIY